MEEVTDDMSLAEGGVRPTLDDEGERDDAKQVLALAIAAIERERGFADQCYLRGRNAFAVSATLFSAAQAAFIASVGREVGDEALLTEPERADVLIPAGIGALFLVVALGLLVFWLDRPRKMTVVGAETLREAWFDPHNKHPDTPVLEVLVSRAIKEESAWAKSNEDRTRALRFIGIACGLAGLASLVQLFVLYTGLT